MGFSRGPSAADRGLKKVIDMGDATALTLTNAHTNTIFLVGEAALAVVLPAAADLVNGWTAMFIGHHATGGTLTNTVTITGAGSNELIGHTVTGADDQNRQIQPSSPAAKDVIKLHTVSAFGDWFEIIKIGSNFFVCGDSRITDGIPLS